jgi:hypothetical protein
VKLLPCPRQQCASRGGYALDRKGMALYAERFPGRPGGAYRAVCHGCGRLIEFTPEAFNGLPDATNEQLAQAGVLDHLTKDLRVAAGLKDLPGVTAAAQAADLFAWGLRHPDEVEPILMPKREADDNEVPDPAA